MDVNRAQAISTVKNNAQGKSGQENADKDGSEDQNDGNAHHAYEAGDAVQIGGLAGEITPAVQKLLDQLASEIEPLRAQLKLAKEREDKLRQDLAAHAFLPVPGRREFLRELNHVLNHLNDLNVMPSVVILHIANANQVRKSEGRNTLDRYLAHVADTINQLLDTTEVLGNLGGDDFALIFLADVELDARERAAQIAKRLEETQMPSHLHQEPPKVLFGVAELGRGDSAEAVIASADSDLLNSVNK